MGATHVTVTIKKSGRAQTALWEGLFSGRHGGYRLAWCRESIWKRLGW